LLITQAGAGPLDEITAMLETKDTRREVRMSRAVFFGTLLFVYSSLSWAQNKTESSEAGPPFLPATSKMTFQWDYSCPGGRNCSFICSGAGERAAHVIRLRIYLGSIPVDSNQNTPAVFYDFSTMEIPKANGFIISAGLSTLSCQVSGMTLDYSGPPK
jgi:hypothetical protein